jgi:dihydroorotase
LIDAATKGDKRFFLGTDSAPHLDGAKIDVCGCAGVFNASFAIEILAQLFDNLGALDNLEGFVSLHGADFYRLPYNKQTLTLFKSDTMLEMPKTLQTEEGNITLFDPQMPVYWHIQS